MISNIQGEQWGVINCIWCNSPLGYYINIFKTFIGTCGPKKKIWETYFSQNEKFRTEKMCACKYHFLKFLEFYK